MKEVKYSLLVLLIGAVTMTRAIPDNPFARAKTPEYKALNADDEIVFTPANWQPDEDMLLAYAKGYSKSDPIFYQVNCYMNLVKQPDLNVQILANKLEIDKQWKGVNTMIE